MEIFFYLTDIFQPFAAGIFGGAFISFTIWLKPENFPLDRDDQKRFLSIMITTIVLAALITISLFHYKASTQLIGDIILTSLFCILARLARLRSKKKPSNRLLLGLTVIDISLSYFTLEFFEIWGKALFTKGMFSTAHIFGFPIFYALICSYIICNYDLIDRQKVRLAAWKLHAYSFPERKIHCLGKIMKPEAYNITVAEIIKWVLMLLVLFFAFLFGYWLASYAWATTVYFVSFIAAFAVVSLKDGWNYKKKDLRRDFYIVVIGSGIILIFTAIFLILASKDVNSEPWLRFQAAIAMATPVALATIIFVPRLLSTYNRKIIKLYKSVHSYLVIRETAFSIYKATFNKKDLRTTQAVLIAGIFILYFLIPRLSPLFQISGLIEINGVPIYDYIARFEEIANTWSIPSSGSADELIKFVFGNQGLVLLFLLWSFTSLINISDVGNRLLKVPRLCDTRLSKLFAGLHLLFFIFYFSPFLIYVSILIPYVGSKFIGYSIAIVLGAFAFSMFFHKMISYLLSLSYLVAVLLNTNTNKDCVCINSSTPDELAMLPGVGKKLAQKIISKRPYSNIHDVIKVEGFGANRFRITKDLIRIG